MISNADRSHEIRTLITRIMGMTDLTLMTELTEEQINYLTIVKSSTGLLIKAFNEMQDTSETESNIVNLKHVSFNLRETLQEVVSLFHVAAKQRNIYIRINGIDNMIPNNLQGDSSVLKQILVTLVGNCLEFVINGEVTINVDLEELQGSSIQLRFIVSYTGVGIPEEKHNKLLESKGFMNSKKLVELMDGDIFFNSTKGVGNKFCFTAKFRVQKKEQELDLRGEDHQHDNHSSRR